MSISFKRSRSSSNTIARARGFTLIELLVVIAIMVIVSAVLLFNQAKFDSSTVMRSLAYGMGLSLRQAQVYGTSVLGTTTTSGNCTNGSYISGVCYAAAYGVHITVGSSYVLFADLNNDGYYDTGEDIKDFSFSPGYTIGTACVDNSNTLYCIAACPPTPYPFSASACNASVSGLSWVDIVFHRPNPDACIDEAADGTNVCTAGASTPYSGAYIELSNNASTRGVIINTTGQITVEAAGT